MIDVPLKLQSIIVRVSITNRKVFFSDLLTFDLPHCILYIDTVSRVAFRQDACTLSEKHYLLKTYRIHIQLKSPRSRSHRPH